MTIKRNFTTKYKLPTFNWVPLKPNQVKGTIFNEFHEEEKIVKLIDFADFEEQFKLGPKISPGARGNEVNRKNSTCTINSNSSSLTGSTSGGLNGNSSSTGTGKRFKAPEKVTMLENNRLRNMAISLKKLNKPTDIVIRTLSCFDSDSLTIEQMEILLRMIPTAAEISAYREYERSGKSIDEMTDEDKFLCAISKIERLEQKAKIIYYMSTLNQVNSSYPGSTSSSGNNESTVSVCKSIIATLSEASKSLKNSQGIRQILEYILVFGNYMNCSTRSMASGPAYGFKLQTLDLITETKSTVDRSRSLLHYVVDVIGKTTSAAAQTDKYDQEQLVKTLKTISPTTANKKFGPGASIFADTITVENTKLPFDLDELLSLLEKAASLSMETVASEVNELDRGMELAKKELSLRQTNAKDMTTVRLQNFVNAKGPEIQGLKDDLKRCQAHYNECVEYFGENPKLLESSSYLFGAFSKFLKQYKQCLYENRLASRKKIEALVAEKMQQLKEQQAAANGSSNGSQGGNNDTPNGTNDKRVREKKLIGTDDLYNGAFEDILMGKFTCHESV